MDPDPNPGGPKIYGPGGSGSGFGSRSATMVNTKFWLNKYVNNHSSIIERKKNNN
jgi:hypothetical protein